MPAALHRELIYLWYYSTVLLEQIVPYWALDMVLGSVISVFGKAKIHSMFAAIQGKRMAAFGVFPASILGIASPLCMYGTIPLAAAFSEGGMEDDWLAAFMMSSILLNPQLSMGSAAAFMITGPATKITNLGALKIVLGAGRFALYIAFVIFFASATGLAVNMFLW